MDDYQLEQVLVLSRHGIRTPLSRALHFLQTITPKPWPVWDVAPGHLTLKGGLIEACLGQDLLRWANQHALPMNNQSTLIYSNSLQRTIATAQSFNSGAFAGLNIPIQHRYDNDQMDPIFDPKFTSDDKVFFNSVKQQIAAATPYSDGLDALNQRFKPAYERLADMLDYRNSEIFKQYQCGFSELPSKIYLSKNEEPSLWGPLQIAAVVVDTFTLQYYSDLALQDVAWGKMTQAADWQMLSDIKNQYMNIMFASPLIARHVSRPLRNHINQLFDQPYSFIFLAGHDSNIASLLCAWQFEHYDLPFQYETTPISGKVLFQRWRHRRSGEQKFKAEYYYLPFTELREANINHRLKPSRYPLSLNQLEKQDGFYNWDEVKQLFSNIN